MTSNSWEKLKELFEEALGQSPEARSRLLDSAGLASEGRKLVEHLLDEHDSSGDFLERGVLASAPQRPQTGGATPPVIFSALREGLLLHNRYLVERELGRGGSGVVYLAHDTKLSLKPVVIKLLHDHMLEGSWWKRTFRSEMEALSRISHPGVVSVLDITDEQGERPFLVMEFIDGVTLRSELATGPLPLVRAASILTQIGGALDAAHSSGVAHRDLKPENIMIQKGSQGTEVVRLIDFGIAKVDECKKDEHTSTLVLVGTTRYMAPEQLLGSASYSIDIYALGVISYEMLTGRCPYQPESAFDLLDMQIQNRLTSPRALRPDLPTAAARLILKALSFRPEDRPVSAGAFACDLAHELRRPWRPRRRMIAVMSAMIAAAVLLAALLFVRRGLTIPPQVDSPLVRIIEKRNSASPTEDGFGNSPEATSNDGVAFNPAASGYEGWRATTRRQSFYTRNLTAAQERAASARGWRISAVTRAEIGGAFVIVAFQSIGRRFDIFTFLDENGDTAVRLITKLVPSFEGLEYHIKGSKVGFHKFELVYDAALRQAELLVDGVPRLGGYAGHGDYADHSWFVFGTHLYHSQSAAATFQTLRFEINP